MVFIYSLSRYLLARRNLVAVRNREEMDEVSNKRLTSMAYDVAELTEKSEELRDARDSRMLGERLELEQEGESLMMYPRACSRFSGLFCRCCSEKVSLKYFLC